MYCCFFFRAKFWDDRDKTNKAIIKTSLKFLSSGGAEARPFVSGESPKRKNRAATARICNGAVRLCILMCLMIWLSEQIHIITEVRFANRTKRKQSFKMFVLLISSENDWT